MVPVLRIGVVSGPSASLARSRLLGLGAVEDDGVASQALDEPGVVLVGATGGPLVPHLVVAVDPDVGVSVADVALSAASEADLEAVIARLWSKRILPFEQNLRLRKRAPRWRTPLLIDPSKT